MNQVEIAWLAGVFEGEGCVIPTGRTGIRVAIEMTDEDIIKRLQQVSGVGRVYGPYDNKAPAKPAWAWVVSRKDHIAYILCAIAPLLGERRRNAIMALEDYRFRYQRNVH